MIHTNQFSITNPRAISAPMIGGQVSGFNHREYTGLEYNHY